MRPVSFLLAPLIALLTLNASTASDVNKTAITFAFDTYENMKENITFPKYSAEQRRFVAEQAKTMFDVSSITLVDRPSNCVGVRQSGIQTR